MTRGQGHQEVESDLSPGDLPAYADDPRADVLKRRSQSPRPSQSPDTLDARMDTGGLTESLPRWATLRRNPFRVVSAAIVVAIILAGGAWWWSYALRYESTDDAFIDARKVQVASALNGIVIEVPVTNNQLADAGAVLVRIDPRDYQAALAQAKAQVGQAVATVDNLDAQIDAQNARIDQAREQVRQAQAATDFAKAENDRAQALLKSGSGTLQQAQQTESNLRQSTATLASAQANLTAAEKQIAVLQTQRDGAAAQLRGRRKGQGRPYAFGSLDEGPVQILGYVALGAVADAVLNGEIGAQSDEQDRERDRDRIELANNHQPKRGCDHEACGQIDDDGKHGPHRLHRQP